MKKRFNVLGRRLRKLDSLKKATGEAIYADDLQLPRMLHCKLLRSPHAHARIKRIDFTRCLKHPGVVAVLEGSEIPTRYGVIPWTPDEQALGCTGVLQVRLEQHDVGVHVPELGRRPRQHDPCWPERQDRRDVHGDRLLLPGDPAAALPR